MHNYASYKKINGDQIEAGTLGSGKFSESPTSGYGVKWFHGTPGACSSDVVVTGQFLLEFPNFGFIGVLVVTDLGLQLQQMSSLYGKWWRIFQLQDGQYYCWLSIYCMRFWCISLLF